MQLPKLQFKKKEPKLSDLRKNIFNPYYYWATALFVFILLSIAGAFVGLRSFQAVYYEDYKNDQDVLGDVASSMQIRALERAIERRINLNNKNLPFPKDPSL